MNTGSNITVPYASRVFVENEIEKFEKTLKTQDFYSPEHEEEEIAKLDKIKENAEKASKKLQRIEELAEDNDSLKRFVEYRLNNKIEQPYKKK